MELVKQTELEEAQARKEAIRAHTKNLSEKSPAFHALMQEIVAGAKDAMDRYDPLEEGYSREFLRDLLLSSVDAMAESLKLAIDDGIGFTEGAVEDEIDDSDIPF